MKRIVLSVCAALAAAVSAWAETYTWTGGTGTWNASSGASWTASSGQSTGTVPGANDAVIIPGAATEYTVTVSEPFAVASLVVGSSEDGTKVKVVFENGVSTNVVSGSVHLLRGATLKHTSKYAVSGSGTAWEKTYTVQRRLLLSVGGDMTIDDGAAIDATGCGYPQKVGPGSGNEYIYGGSYGGHGQRKTIYPACYGSIRAPMDYGSGGEWGSGGGSINLVVSGDLTVNGAIRSNGQAVSERGDAGGSVFLTVGALLGEGFIEANGSLCSYGGAGGRISIVEKIAEVSQFTKNISCIGSDSGGASASGTIYRENASDKSGRGTLIVPSQKTANTSYQTELAASRMPDANEPFGAIFVEKNAGLRLFAGTTCTVTRVLSVVTGNGASFTADLGSCLKFIDASCDACVTGALTFAGLECTEPGKRIVFTPGTAGKTSIKAGGLLTVRGTEESPVELWGVDGAEWLLNLDASAETDILHASVTNSNASSGSSVLAISSNDLGGNQKWSFKDPILPGEVNEWTGTESSDWSDEKNWSCTRLPLETDDVRILDPTAPHFPVMTVANTRWNKLTVGEGTTLTLSGSTIDVTNELTVAGTLVFSGRQNLSITAPTASFAGATVVPAESTVRILDGVDTFDPGDCTFCRVEILRAGGELALTDGFKARSFEVRATDDVTLTFAAGKTIEADTIVCSCRAADKYLTLQSSAADEKWFLKSPRISYMTGVRVSDSTASDAKAVASLSVNIRESNTNWVFDNGVSEWVGGASGKFDVAANWYPAGVPGATNDVILRGAAEITADGNVSVRALTLLPDEVKGSLTVKGVLSTVGDAVVGTNATLTLSTVTDFNEIGGDLVVQTGGTVTHSALSSTANTLADSRNGAKLIVRAKNILVEEGGTITAVGKGFPIVKGPAALGSRSDANGTTYSMGAGHAGTVNHSRSGAATTSVYPVLTDYRAYGSMFEPMTHGSGGNESSPGGGVIRLVVSGDLTVDGTISAAGKDGWNYGHSGAGGSVWITVAGALKGAATGLISAAGGKGLHQNAAGGGRIAVYAGINIFNGRFSASGKKEYTTGVMTQAPGTVLTKFGDEEIYSLVLDYDEYTSALSGYGSDGNLAMLATDIPTEEDLDKLELFKRTSITCGHLTVLNLTRDLKLYDLNFTEAAGSKARLNLHTLKLLSSAHKKGRGWAVKNAGDDPIATHIWPCEKDGAKGKVVWSAGMALIVR